MTGNDRRIRLIPKGEKALENRLFRQQSMDQVNSPEQIRDYLRVTSPKLWMVIAAVLVLLAGFLAYLSVAEKEITVRDLKTSEDVADWNAGKIPVALISPASAGHGLNLQHGGHILIWFSLCWSLEMRQQTDARLNRQGQTEVVTIHNIVTKDTIDEDVLKALDGKNTTQENLIRAVQARLK